MVRTTAQHSRIAAIYERAARDLTLPPQPRAAFAKKASWFRMLAQIEAAKAAAASASTPNRMASQRNGPKFASGDEKLIVLKRDGPTPAERLSCASAVRGVEPIGFLTQDIFSKPSS